LQPSTKEYGEEFYGSDDKLGSMFWEEVGPIE
jgi:hypothetical protein